MVIGKKNSLVRIKKISTNSGYYIFVPDGFERTGKLINPLEKGYNIIATIVEEEKELILLFAGIILKISKGALIDYLVETETAIFEIDVIEE